jgi:uncharacterized protein
MEKPVIEEFKPGRRFFGRLPMNADIIGAMVAICREHDVRMGDFSLRGAVSSACLGVLDQKQQVFVTHTEAEPLEIVLCKGNVSPREGRPFIHAHILLCDSEGRVRGGRLFSETRVFCAEFDLTEFTGKPLNRAYDLPTGQILWQARP